MQQVREKHQHVLIHTAHTVQHAGLESVQKSLRVHSQVLLHVSRSIPTQRQGLFLARDHSPTHDLCLLHQDLHGQSRGQDQDLDQGQLQDCPLPDLNLGHQHGPESLSLRGVCQSQGHVLDQYLIPNHALKATAQKDQEQGGDLRHHLMTNQKNG